MLNNTDTSMCMHSASSNLFITHAYVFMKSLHLPTFVVCNRVKTQQIHWTNTDCVEQEQQEERTRYICWYSQIYTPVRRTINYVEFHFRAWFVAFIHWPRRAPCALHCSMKSLLTSNCICGHESNGRQRNTTQFTWNCDQSSTVLTMLSMKFSNRVNLAYILTFA